ncbi:hypothetical protein C1I98_03190 [Spongiactinospora gelatinilytica]|uniref:Uncharacterized protein n=1 Tax=Spongiactinospora gelatinilytica TaxID=2666298 RepID=A0A2W2HKB7_9ACTN|nr:hypothetical protein [Spongiactinospora gelatinilytica]PZG55519.1 hypothetical protein C1I98_03190 [Spongiactinospora gelatinilytica]
MGGVLQALLPGPLRPALLAPAAAAVLLREAGVLRFAVPENRRLVPEHVVLRGPVAGALQFGFEMGTGMRTYSPSALPHLLLAALLLAVPPAGALAAATGFAAARWAAAAATVAHDGSTRGGSWDARWRTAHRPLALATALATVISLACGISGG